MFEQRVLIAVAAMCLALALLLARLAWLQIINHQHYTTLSQENRLKILPLAPPRGLIYSSDGVVLAENRPSFSLTVVPENTKDLQGALGELQVLLKISQDELEQFTKQFRSARRFENVTVKSDLTPEELAIFSVDQFRYPGFGIQAGLARHYPQGPAMAHVVGYVGRISEADLATIEPSNYRATTHIGKLGVEKSREELLHGRVGYQRVEINAQGRILRVVERVPPLPGSNVYLTIDAELQNVAIAALGEYKGAIVALDPATGGILAFASTPSFDPNAFVNGIGSALYKSWITSPARPLYNRAMQGQYPPGSTIKPMMALAGLEAGIRVAEDTTWCPGFYTLAGHNHRYRDWLKQGHGRVNLKFSIAHSCDVYYYKLAHELGIARIHDMLGKFGLGAATGVDIPGEAGGLLPSPEWKKRVRNLPWYPGETLIAGIGQGFMLTTPLQLAYSTGIIAARGEVHIPHFVEQIEDPQGNSVIPSETYQRERLVVANDHYWEEIISGMFEVVHGPTGTARKVGEGAPVKFAGKTGTAQVFGIAQGQTTKNEELPEHLRDHALFIAFAPLDKPQIALAIVVEHGSSGSRTAAPIARRLLDHFFAGKTVGEVSNR